MDDHQLGLCFELPSSSSSSSSLTKEGELIAWSGDTPPQESTSDEDFSSFLDFILSQDFPPPSSSSPLPPEIDPFALDLPLDEAFFVDVLEGDKGSTCSSGVSVNLEKDEMVAKQIEGGSGDEGAAAHDGLSRSSRAVEEGGQIQGRPVYSPNNPSDQECDLSKRHIRLMKNRQSATESRQRKKSYVRDLEAKCRMLDGHCSLLKQAMAFKDMEICLLREELAKAKRLKSQDGVSVCVAEPAVLVKNSLPLEFLSHRALKSVGRCLEWTVQLLFLLLLLSLMQEIPKRDQSGSDLKMDKTRGAYHTLIGYRETRGLLSTKGRRQEHGIPWKQKCFAYLRRRKKIPLHSWPSTYICS